MDGYSPCVLDVEHEPMTLMIASQLNTRHEVEEHTNWIWILFDHTYRANKVQSNAKGILFLLALTAEALEKNSDK